MLNFEKIAETLRKLLDPTRRRTLAKFIRHIQHLIKNGDARMNTNSFAIANPDMIMGKNYDDLTTQYSENNKSGLHFEVHLKQLK